MKSEAYTQDEAGPSLLDARQQAAGAALGDLFTQLRDSPVNGHNDLEMSPIKITLIDDRDGDVAAMANAKVTISFHGSSR